MVLSFLVAVPRINLFWHSSQRQSKRRIGNARFSSFRPKAPEAGSSAARLCVKLAKRDQAVIEQRIQRQLIAILAADVAGCAADIQQQMAEQSAGTDKDRLPTS
jgi:hypothetical protein